MRRRILLYATAMVVVAASVMAQDLDALGPQVGARVPDFKAVDQFGDVQTLQTVMGPDGAMLVFYRSADW